MDFPKQAHSAWTPPPDISQRIDTVFFKPHTDCSTDDWKAQIKKQILGELEENLTGQALTDLIQKEQEILAKEVRWLQDKAGKARRRAGERKGHRNNTQNNLRQRISLLKAALAEAELPQSKDKIRRATRKAMRGLGFLHLRDTLQKLVWQHTKWTSLLTEEIRKAEKLVDRENHDLTQNRKDKSRDIRRKNEILKNGIKVGLGIFHIMSTKGFPQGSAG